MAVATKRIAILTGGGDCPGLNAAIRMIAKTAMNDYRIEVWGIEDGFAGLIERRAQRLDNFDVSGILTFGGTILGSSNKDNPFDYPVAVDGHVVRQDLSVMCQQYIHEMKWDALVCIGGDGTQKMAYEFQRLGVNVVGVPKTIDNDLRATDCTVGFNTAVSVGMEAIDRLHTTAMSHHRVQVIEMMGRYVGWLALMAGVAGGGDVILIPEIPYDLEKVSEACLARSKTGKRFTIVVVAEGASAKGGDLTVGQIIEGRPDPIRLGGVGHRIAYHIEQTTGLEARATVLGHLQRGGSPTAYDRLLASQLGHKAVTMVVEGRFGRMAALRGNEIIDVPLQDAIAGLKIVPVNHPLITAARSVGTCFGD